MFHFTTTIAACSSSSEATNIQENILQSGFPAFPLKYSCKYSNALHACQNSHIFMNHLHLNLSPCIFISVSTSLCLLSQF